MPIDRRRYPPDWEAISRRVRDRDKHTCQHCQAKEGEYGHWINGQWTADPYGQNICVLTVAHLDHNEWDHALEDVRLTTLCSRCHLTYDRADNISRRKYGQEYARFQKKMKFR